MTAIDQSVKNVPTPDIQLSTSLQPTTHPSNGTRNSAVAVVTPGPNQTPVSSETTRASARSKKPTRFFGDPLCHAVKTIEEETSEQSTSAVIPVINLTSPHKRIELICQRPAPITQEHVTLFHKNKMQEPKEKTHTDI